MIPSHAIDRREMTKVQAMRCKWCGVTIFSRARHDFRSCACEKVSIDGGRDYTKVSSSNDDAYEPMTLVVYATPWELYNDWNCGIDKWGRYTEEEFGQYANILVSPKESK